MKQATFKIKKLLSFFFCFFLGVTCYMLNVTGVGAQQISLGLSPPLLELVIKPGKSVVIGYKLENFSDPVIITTKVLPFKPKDDLGRIEMLEEFEGPIRFALDNSEIDLGQPFFLKTRQSQQLLLRIRVPEKAPEGDYYYSFLCQTQAPPTKEGESSSRINAGIGSNILITVSEAGQTEIKGRISFFDVLSRFQLNLFNNVLNFFESSDKIPIVLIVENRGKNLIKPYGAIELGGNFGEKARYEILPDNILANSQRLLNATASAEIDCPASGNKPFYCRRPATLLLSGFFVGRYRLSASINFGEGTPNLFASTSFIAVPLKLIIAIVVVFFIGILVIKKLSLPDKTNA